MTGLDSCKVALIESYMKLEENRNSSNEEDILKAEQSLLSLMDTIDKEKTKEVKSAIEKSASMFGKVRIIDEDDFVNCPNIKIPF